MAILCFEPVAGAAGNMILGALFDLGVSPDQVDQTLRSAGLHDFEIKFQRKTSHGISCGYCEVTTDETHAHRHLPTILDIIERTDTGDRAKSRACAIFRRLAEAEAAVHQISPEKVHFHEVGAVDAIVDILGSCIALDLLQVDHIYCSSFRIGKGTVKCAHGTLPVPAPATVRLLEGFPVTRLDIQSELTTPTGAAILTTLSEGDWAGLDYRLMKSGIGIGTRQFAQIPNAIRAFLGETLPEAHGVEVLETEIDDQTPEATAAVCERLRQAGALDVNLIPCQMKKGRPGIRLSVVCTPGTATALADILFAHSSTIGVRLSRTCRLTLPRQETCVPTRWGDVRAKRIERPSGVEITPEFDACSQIAREHNIPIRHVMCEAHCWEDSHTHATRPSEK